jgi:L-rhamnose mutarotase
MKRYSLALDLVDDPALIAEYEQWHKAGSGWPEITKSIKDAGIIDMQIYRYGNHLFMIMDVNETFDFERKAAMDAENPKVQEWETLMWRFQQPLNGAKPGEKWVIMDRIFQLAE